MLLTLGAEAAGEGPQAAVALSAAPSQPDVPKQKALMQATSTTGWYGYKKGLGSDLKNTDFDDLIRPNRLGSKTQAMTNSLIEDEGASTAR